ncbi:hypothetical protein D7U98_14820 [Stenotrophomonas maltophilia]|uniref:Uncharacterized protein n=1 Tax=Stenotrophomonas maltophilia (strain R551-3) TaxID=391008 RepID=B4SRU9_STRM5|nr:hypothetical protein Smal_0114 [Stenotrophomonas maltophilia R551-3]MBA0396663.1 hypothetical protein [Stenotrophomonas maltophilia]CCP14144.1 hypothetical protein SMRA8_0329 [Stenotrophomonas maltophilia RA8]MBH1495438.1 hypothetical protein [Stenotrophomonas maltophilia]MBN4962216.1 hypothetical protein [Stenotrophomonas maltophilia]
MMRTWGSRLLRVVAKAGDWLHLLLWAASITYLMLSFLSWTVFHDYTFMGLTANSFYVRYRDFIFWYSYAAVPVLTAVVIALIWIRRRVAPAEMLIAFVGWGLLLFHLSLVRS